jgi:hypothetical protein
LLDSLCGMFHSHGCGCCSCCEPCCGCNSCGCGCDSCGSGCSSCGGSTGCGCNGGGEKAEKKSDEKAPAAPAEAGASVRPVAPRPMADPNASVGQQRNVVRTSFLR